MFPPYQLTLSINSVLFVCIVVLTLVVYGCHRYEDSQYEDDPDDFSIDDDGS